jgi:hypothetical protein
MSVQSFLKAAQYLYDNNFYDEAFCLVCVALDASAQIQYPSLKVGERYKKFISTNFRKICDKGFPGVSADFIKIKVNADVKKLKLDEDGYAGMEDIIYHVIRCGLVHDCAIDQTIRFIDSTVIGNWEKGLFFLPKSLIMGLIDAIRS